MSTHGVSRAVAHFHALPGGANWGASQRSRGASGGFGVGSVGLMAGFLVSGCWLAALWVVGTGVDFCGCVCAVGEGVGIEQCVAEKSSGGV